MKYALISDIHGNKYALKAVLADAQEEGVEKYVFLGDYFMSIPYANETIDILQRQENAFIIGGNEEDHLNYDFGDDMWVDNGQFSAVYHTYHHLNDNTKDFLSITKTHKVLLFRKTI